MRPIWISVGWIVFLALAAQACASGPSPTPEPSATPAARPTPTSEGPMVIDWGRAEIAYPESAKGEWTSVTTLGNGRAAFAKLREPRWESLDLERYHLQCRVRTNLIDRVGLELRLSETTGFESYAAFQIPFFTDEQFNRVQPGEWTTVSFGLGDARLSDDPDLTRLTHVGWYVRDNGEGKVVFEFTDIELVPRPREGVVSFTFDDGYSIQMEAARILAKHGLAGTAYVMPRQIGSVGYMGPEELRELTQDYGWEVASHHADPFTEFTRETLAEEIDFGLGTLADLGFHETAGHLAYPLGKLNTEFVLNVVREWYTSARLASGWLETLPPADWHLLRAVNVTRDTSPEEVLQLVDRAKKHGQWAILMFHRLVELPRWETDYNAAEFERLARLVAESGVQVRTVGEVWSQYGEKLASQE